MKNKLLMMFLVVVIALPVFTSVFALSSEELLARLDGISQDISSMKQEYEGILNTYSDVIASLSEENKQAALNLTENLMASDIQTVVTAIKTELAESSVADADKVLAAIEDLQSDAEALIEENKDVVEEVKSGYQDLTVEEVKQIVEKVKDITDSLGAEVDTSNAYADMMTILDDAHAMALDINDKIEVILDNNLENFKTITTMEFARDLFNAIKTKDVQVVIDTIVDALNETEELKVLKEELKDLKNDAVALKDKLMEIANLNEEELLFFTDEQKADVQDKVKEVEVDYVEFAKVLLDTYSEKYMSVVIEKTYNIPVDDMVRYGNRLVDYVVKYKETIKNLTVEDIVSVLPQDLVQKAGIFVALGFVDISEYNLEYIKTNFKTQIDNFVNYTIDQIWAYINNIDARLQQEVNTELNGENEISLIQSNIRAMSVARFATLESITELKERVETELIASRENLKEKLDMFANDVYNVYHVGVVEALEHAMECENKKEDKKYEYNFEKFYILTDNFMKCDSLMAEIGLDGEISKLVSFENSANDAIKTGTSLNLDISDEFDCIYECIVLGDVYADGMIDARDYMAIKNQIMETDNLSATSLLAADPYRDGTIDARDYMVIKNEIMEGNAIVL